ncbi:ABC transporter permease [Nesterenkonia suensis]
MTVHGTATDAEDTPRAAQTAAPRKNPWQLFLRRPMTIFFISLLALIVAVCMVGPAFGHSPSHTGFAVLQPPNPENPMGTDHLGRDMLARLMLGGRISIFVGLAVALLCLTLGIVIGGLAGFYGGLMDAILMRISDFFQVIPGIIIALVAVAILGSNLSIIIIVLALTFWPGVARVVRAECMRVRELGYVESSFAAGFSSLRIFRSDVLPNAFGPILVATTMTVGRAILAESSLAFLGLGDANVPSWGALLYFAQPYMQLAWWLTVVPGLAIFLVVLAMNMLGDGLNDSFNPTISRVK